MNAHKSFKTATVNTEIHYPDDSDIKSLVRFDADTGLIWQGEDRVLLMHAAAISALRNELIELFGLDYARGLITRMGYVSGVRDAELAKKLRPENELEAFLCGPQLHMLKGIAQVRLKILRMDIKKGQFYGEFMRQHSWEDETDIADARHSEGPMCWHQIGYSTGYTSSLMGKFILFNEVECVSKGDSRCLTIGKPAEEWQDQEEQMQYFKPVSLITQILDLQSYHANLKSASKTDFSHCEIIGESSAFKRSFEQLIKAAETKITVLIQGETGVGKELFAKALHDRSARAAAPFIAVNCGAIPADLIESELFGVERGAYTGAHQSRPGRFERAHGGTIFLDEIGELPAAAQSKLLRVLQEGEVERLGGTHTHKVDVRVVAATNVDLEQATQSGNFRRDLYYRLNAYPVLIPPLRDRVQDIPLLAERLLQKHSSIYGKKVRGFSDRAIQALKSYRFPGNIRELSNMIERGITLAPSGGQIEVADLFTIYEEDKSKPAKGLNLFGAGSQCNTLRQLCEAAIKDKITINDIESELLLTALDSTNGNLSAAARSIGITRAQFEYRLKKRGH